jgi:hypothetical protein
MLWQKYFALAGDHQINPATGKSYLNSKEDLKNALEHMQVDDLIMIDGEDVILISGN